MDIPTILTLIGWAVEEEPKVEQAIRNLLAKKETTTPADWQAERDLWVANSYKALVPDSKLPNSP